MRLRAALHATILLGSVCGYATSVCLQPGAPRGGAALAGAVRAGGASERGHAAAFAPAIARKPARPLSYVSLLALLDTKQWPAELSMLLHKEHWQAEWLCFLTDRDPGGQDQDRAEAPQPPSEAVVPRHAGEEHFDPQRARRTVYHLCGFGPHPGGSHGERLLGDYLARQLRQYGYQVKVQSNIRMGSSGARTRNVYAFLPSEHSRARLVIGAHYDSKQGPGRLGANDNGSGVAVVLELARIAAGTDLPYSVEFVFFGAEEEDWPYGCFFGSKWFISQLDPGAIAAMICVDMVGRGDRMYAWYTGQRPAKLTASLARDAEQLQLPLAIRQGLPHSDHVPFEWAQVPAIWLQRLPDPDNHTARDRPENVSVEALAQVGELVERQVRGE